MNKDILFILVSLIFFASCEEESNVNYEPDIVVEAYLHEGEVIEIELTQEIPFKQESYDLINFEEVTVAIEYANTSLLLEYLGDGKFIGDSTFVPDAGEIYALEISLDDKDIGSETIIPSKPQNFEISTTSIEVDNSGTGGLANMSESVELFWDNPDADYYLLKIENIESNPVAIFDEDRPGMSNRVLQEEGTQIRPMQFEYYGTHQIILYHINDELAAIYDDQENSSQNLTDPTTNITNGYGIFTGINTDTLFLEVTQP